MKGFALLIVCLLWLWGLYYGYTLIVSKSLKSAPQQKKSSEAIRKEDTERQKARDSIQKQRDLMHDRERTMRFHQNR